MYFCNQLTNAHRKDKFCNILLLANVLSDYVDLRLGSLGVLCLVQEGSR